MREGFDEADGAVALGEPAAIGVTEQGWEGAGGGERGEGFYQRPDGNGLIGIGPVLLDYLAGADV